MAQEDEVKPRSKPLNETRKIRKPLMERKRRERINTSLNELANLLTEAQKVKTDGSKITKLEKADILELTVRHLQSLHDTRNLRKTEPSCTKEEKFQEGFSECIRVVEKALKKSRRKELKDRLLAHLNVRLKSLRASLKRKTFEEGQEEKENRHCNSESPIVLKSSEIQKDQSSNKRCSFTFIPTELPDGGMAFVLAGNPRTLLKKWESLSLEAKLPINQVNNSVLLNGSSSELSAQWPKTSLASTQTETDCPSLPSQHPSITIHPASPSTTNDAFYFCDTDIKYNGIQPLNHGLSCSSTGGLTRPRTKTHYPPTPPPSPLYSDEDSNPVRQAPAYQRARIRDGNVLRNVKEQEMVEPFDLRVARMWRPW